MAGEVQRVRHLSLLPPVTVLDTRPEEVRALLEVARWWQRTDWDRVGVLVLSAFNVWLALILLLAPDAQVFTQGSLPPFRLMSPEVWAVGFAAGGVAAGALAWQVTGARQVVAWLLIFPAQTVWLGASIIAVLGGSGSAIAVVLWSVILAFTALTAIRLAIAYTSGKR